MRPNSCECWCDWIIIWIRLETHKYRRPLPLVSAKQPRSLQLYDISQTGVLRWALAFYILTYRRQWLSHMLQWRPLLIHLLSCTNRRGQPRSLHISLRKTYCLHTLCSSAVLSEYWRRLRWYAGAWTTQLQNTYVFDRLLIKTRKTIIMISKQSSHSYMYTCCSCDPV